MAHSRGSGFRTTRSPRRKTAWEIGPQTGSDGTAQAFASSTSLVASGALTVAADGITLVRTRGELLLFLTSAAAAGDGFAGAFGIGVANIAAIAAGIVSLPTPIDEEAWDGWLYHRYFHVAASQVMDATAATDANGMFATCAALRTEVDSKAMRKLEIDQGIFAACQVNEIGTAVMSWAFNSRTLIKLP